ncbi:MAG: GNAT family N-acetyltransferase [Thermoplasmata archaeon]|nr:GNAT family N-acetyltransferase [Thermoplasmata archaeon]
MEALIREFTEDDYTGCVRVWKETNLYVWYMDNKKDIMAFHRRNPDLFLVAEVDGEVVGAVMGMFSGNFAVIYHLAVLPEFQRRGIGSALLKEMERRLKERGARFYMIFNHSTHSPARGFYRKMGLRSVGEFRGLYKLLKRAEEG